MTETQTMGLRERALQAHEAAEEAAKEKAIRDAAAANIRTWEALEEMLHNIGVTEPIERHNSQFYGAYVTVEGLVFDYTHGALRLFQLCSGCGSRVFSWEVGSLEDIGSAVRALEQPFVRSRRCDSCTNRDWKGMP